MFPPDAKTMRRPEASHRASATEDRREGRSHAGAEPQKFHEKLPRDLFMFNSSGLLRKSFANKVWRDIIHISGAESRREILSQIFR